MKKPNLKFLKKVAERQVYAGQGYSMKRGGYFYFRGGEATAKKHAAAGFVTMGRRGCSLGRPSYVELTDAGRAALVETP